MKTISFLRFARICGSLAVCALAFSASAQPAQPMSMPSGHTGMSHGPQAASSPSTRAFQESSEKMMKGMDAPYTGDADRDFVSQMIVHHEGAVSMAEVELKYGKDPAIRKLARNIIKAQKQEIALMKQWQARHGGR